MSDINETSVALLLGDPDGSGGAARVEELKIPSPATGEAVVEQLGKAGITPSDVRARVELVLPPTIAPLDATVLYATLAGFVGRFVPASLTDGQVPANVDAPPMTPRPDVIEDDVTIGSESTLADPQVHYARRALVDLTGLSTREALLLVAAVAAARRRPRHERFPDVAVGGAEPARLEEARKAGLAHRGELRKSVVGTLVDPRDPSPRLQRLHEAASAPIADVLRRLGATTDETGEKWHCSRPSRHNNGDQNPSLKIVDGKTRCFRCDPEWVDSLRLVSDTLDLSPDEAAAWIESGTALPPLR